MELFDQRKAALTVGISLIIMAIAAFYSYGFVFGSLVIQEDAHLTFTNLTSSNVLFNSGILGWLIVLICDVVVAWGLYVFLKPINESLSLLSAWLRIVYSGILGIGISILVLVSIMTNTNSYLTELDINELQDFTMLFLKTFEQVWSIGLIIFGLHLLMIGYLSLKSDFVPRIISILLVISSLSYITIHFSYTFLPQFEAAISIIELILMVPMAVGELGFGLWLFFKGGRVPKKIRTS